MSIFLVIYAKLSKKHSFQELNQFKTFTSPTLPELALFVYLEINV